MILREAIRQVRGFRYMIEQLDICSAVGRRVLYDLPWLDSKSRLEAEFERIQKIMVLFEQPENESRLERLTGKLMQVRDIRGTIGRMAMEQVLDDLELFELKTFALCSEEIRGLVEEWGLFYSRNWSRLYVCWIRKGIGFLIFIFMILIRLSWPG